MAVFRNYFNEQFSRDTSKKVRAVRKMCAQSGKYTGAYASYGYRKDENNKHLLVPDQNTAPIVRKIYEQRCEGMGYKAIAQYLNESGVIPPRDYYYQQYKNCVNPQNVSHCCNLNTVREILRNEVYIGNMVQLRFGSASYKSHKLVAKPQDEWVRVEGTHEAIIPRELWDRVRKIGEKRYQPRKQKDGKASIFSGLLVCADCGFKIRILTQKRTRKNGDLYSHTSFVCGYYARSGKTACTTHTIGEKILHQLLAEQIREHARMVECDEALIVEKILRMQNSESEASRTSYLNELKTHQNRLAMLDRLIEKLYEDRLTGTVPETVFRNLIQKYEQERVDRQQSAQNFETRICSIRQSGDGAGKWAILIKQCVSLDTLGAQTLLLLVDCVEIGDAVTAHGQKARDIRIVCNYVGDVSGLYAVDGDGAGVYEQAV